MARRLKESAHQHPSYWSAWWCHQMDTFSALLAICTGNSPVPGEFPTQRPVTRSLNVFFDLRLNKRLSKQSWGWWFETPWHPLWRHSNGFWRNFPAFVPEVSFPQLRMHRKGVCKYIWRMQHSEWVGSFEITLIEYMTYAPLYCSISASFTHYNDVIMGAMASQITTKENIKAPRHWPLCGEFTGDRWIPRTNGQIRG